MSHILRRSNQAEIFQKRPVVPITHILSDYLGIGLAIGAYAFVLLEVWWSALVILVIGIFQYRLQIIAHDGIHFSLHPNHAVNDFITRYLITGPELTPLSLNRKNHLRHHRYIGRPEDDDWHYYSATDKRPSSRFIRWLVTDAFLGGVFVIGRKLLTRRVQSRARSSHGGRGRSWELIKDVLSIVIGQSVIFVAFALTLGPWYYLLFWIVPFLFVFLPLNTIRSFCEHSIPAPDDSQANRLFTFQSNLLERFILAPHNMNLHYEHHAHMTVPYYNLPLLHAEMRRRPGYDNHLRQSYITHLFGYSRMRNSEFPA